MLWIHALCITRRDPKKLRIEHAGILKHSPRRYVVRAALKPRTISCFQFGRREVRDRDIPRGNVLPERLDIRSSGKPPRHANNGKAIQQLFFASVLARYTSLIVPRTHVATPCVARARANAPLALCACCWTALFSDAEDPLSERRLASVRTVGHSNINVTGNSLSKCACNRRWALISSRDVPPQSKKLSSSPIVRRSRTSTNTRDTCSSASDSDRGAEPAGAAEPEPIDGVGRAAASSLPFTVSGSFSRGV